MLLVFCVCWKHHLVTQQHWLFSLEAGLSRRASCWHLFEIQLDLKMLFVNSCYTAAVQGLRKHMINVAALGALMDARGHTVSHTVALPT